MKSLIKICLISFCVGCSSPNNDISLQKEKGSEIDFSNLINQSDNFNSTSLDFIKSLKNDTTFYNLLINNYHNVDSLLSLEIVNNLVLKQILFETREECVTYDLMDPALDNKLFRWILNIVLSEMKVNRKELEWFNKARLHSFLKENGDKFPHDKRLVLMIDLLNDSCMKN